MSDEIGLRPGPCASCPYRRDVPSGVWAEEEYDKLPLYDGETFDQSPAVFMCHQRDETLCAGWLGHRDPDDLLAVRLGVSMGVLPVDVFEYRTKVPLFRSGAEASAHGKKEIENPGEAARKLVRKFV